MSVGSKIKQCREALDMTQGELGRLCGTSKQTIFKYESEIVTNIPLDRLEMIANALGVTQAYLMGWEEKEEQPTDNGELSEEKRELHAYVDTISEEQAALVLKILKYIVEEQA